MTTEQRQLLAASRLLRRLAEMGEPVPYEGFAVRDLAYACAQAANDLRLVELREEIGRAREEFSVKVPTLSVIRGGAA
jgi:hypothetical protein